MIFIRRARNLTAIKVGKFVRLPSEVKRFDKMIIYYETRKRHGPIYDKYFEEQTVINFSSMNMARAKLSNAKTVTLYVKEHVYLATKWVMRKTFFKFIQLKRLECFEWDDYFY